MKPRLGTYQLNTSNMQQPTVKGVDMWSQSDKNFDSKLNKSTLLRHFFDMPFEVNSQETQCYCISISGLLLTYEYSTWGTERCAVPFWFASVKNDILLSPPQSQPCSRTSPHPQFLHFQPSSGPQIMCIWVYRYINKFCIYIYKNCSFNNSRYAIALRLTTVQGKSLQTYLNSCYSIQLAYQKNVSKESNCSFTLELEVNLALE